MNDSSYSKMPTDSFSLNRMGMLFLFYSSSIKKQLLIYFSVSVLFALLLLIPGPDGMRTGFFSLAWTTLQWMWFLSPLLMSGRGRSGIIDRMLPVKASEMTGFFILYFMVVIPLLLFTIPVCTEIIIYKSLDASNPGFKEVLGFQLNSSWVVKLINLFSGWATAIVCLYTVLKSRHNKMLFGILSAFGVEILLGILGGILGGYEAFRKGLEDGYCGREPVFDEMSTLEFTNTILQPSPATFTVIGIIFFATILFLVLIYRRLRYKNL